MISESLWRSMMNVKEWKILEIALEPIFISMTYLVLFSLVLLLS
jgi:hypothetical protein